MTTTTARALVFGFWFLVFGCACGAKKTSRALEGSLTVLLPMGYDSAHVELTLNDIAVRFARKQGEGEDVVFKVAASLSGAQPKGGEPIDLAEDTPQGTQRGTATRNVLADTRPKTFPRIARGKMLFDRFPVVGETVTGEVNVTFENGTDVASGRTVFGDFEANVQ